MKSMLPDAMAIQLRHLTKRFNGHTAVNDLTLGVPIGSTFGLIGPNGAGKTTTIKMLMGVSRPTEGVSFVLGQDVLVAPLAVRQRVGYVPELHNIDRWIEVGRLVEFCRSVYASWNDRLCHDLLRLFALDPYRKVKQLSKGMVVKLSLVLAVSHNPDLLVLDEPMAGLDPVAREEFLDGVLQTICDQGQTVLFSTHSLDDVQRMADTVGILYEGSLLVHENIEQLLSSTKRIRATITGEVVRLDDIVPDPIWQRFQGREWMATINDFKPEVVDRLHGQEGIEHVQVIDLGLEDLFKDYVKGRKAKS